MFNTTISNSFTSTCNLMQEVGYNSLKRQAFSVELNGSNTITKNQKRRKVDWFSVKKQVKYLDYDREKKNEEKRRRCAIRRLASGYRQIPEPMDLDVPEVGRLMVAEAPLIEEDVVMTLAPKWVEVAAAVVEEEVEEEKEEEEDVEEEEVEEEEEEEEEEEDDDDDLYVSEEGDLDSRLFAPCSSDEEDDEDLLFYARY